MNFHILSSKVKSMKVLVIRKVKMFKKLPPSEIIRADDVEIEVLYLHRISKKFRKSVRGFVISEDFDEWRAQDGSLMHLFPGAVLRKIASRHGVDLENEALEVVTDTLSEKNKEILTLLSLEVRFMTLHTSLAPDNFDFLLENAGISPKIVKNSDACKNLTVYLNDEFLIKHMPSGKTYYDIKLKLPDVFYEYYLPEGHSIFSEYIKTTPQARQNVKISDLMSK